MRMARWFVVFVMAVVLGSPLKSDAQSPILANDAAEIHAALGGIQSAWNHHDMTAFVSYMTDDVEWVNIVGMCWRGKAQVLTQAIPMDGFSSPNGSPTPPNRNMLTLVFVHRDGRWLVAEGHNTVIDPQAAAHDPGK